MSKYEVCMFFAGLKFRHLFLGGNLVFFNSVQKQIEDIIPSEILIYGWTGFSSLSTYYEWNITI